MMPKSCRGKLKALVLMILFMVCINSALIFAVLLHNESVRSDSYPATAAANEMEKSVIQVQQFLSDISATRAQDGKDDGFANAAENAQSFKTAISEYRKLKPEKSAFLDQYEQSFDVYYALGKKMAQAYIDEGPAGGNQLMPQFDAQSETLADFTAKIRLESEGEMQSNLEKIDFQLKLVLAIVLGSGFVTLLAAMSLIRLITTSFATLEQGIAADSDGQIRLKEISLQRDDEFGRFAAALNTLLRQFSSFIQQVSSLATNLTTSAEELNATVEQSAQAADMVAESTTQVAQGAQTQLQLAQKTKDDVNRIADAINSVSSNAGYVSQTADQTNNTASSGEQTIHQAVDQMNIIETKTNASVEAIHALDEKSGQIGQIIEVIAGIAGQTNLLALNAAIESARAGEAGRGFAVVAEEIRKLAEQSQTAAKQITALISEVQLNTNRAVTFMQQGKLEVDAGSTAVAGAGQSFSEITSMVQLMTKGIGEITAAITAVTSHSQTMVHAVETIHDESRQVSDQAQSISAASEEQSASLEEISGASHNLAKMAEELQRAIRAFKI